MVSNSFSFTFLQIALVVALAAGCSKQTSNEPKLQENTEVYLAAHGIVPGQVNELHIGGTLFRFPAGVGLNPYTAQAVIRSIDGSPMTLSSKEGLEQGKYKKVDTPIVKGRADKVTFYLDPERGYAPNPSPFGWGVRVELSPVGIDESESMRLLIERIHRDTDAMGNNQDADLNVFAPKSGTNIGTYYYQAIPLNSPSGERVFFTCPASEAAQNSLCRTYYSDPAKRFSVGIFLPGSMLLTRSWQEAYTAVVRFVDSVVAQ